MGQSYEFTLNAENIDACSELAYDFFKGKPIEERNLAEIRMKLEAVLLIWLESMPEDTEIKIRAREKLGRYLVTVVAAGDLVNPLRRSTDEAIKESTLFFYKLLVNANVLSVYEYSDGLNIVEFDIPKKPIGALGRVAIALGGGIAVGLVGHFVLPLEAALLICKDFIAPVTKAILGLLGGLANVYVFISIVNAICNMENVQSLGRIGKKVIITFGKINLLALVLCGLAFVDVVSTADAGGVGVYKFVRAFYQMIVGIVPSNIIEPFAKKNTMQVLFLAVMFGQVILILGNKMKELRQLIGNLNILILMSLKYICKGLPIVVFFCMLDIVLGNRLGAIFSCWRTALTMVVITYIVSLVVCFWGHIRKTVDFSKLGTDLREVFLIGLSTGSRTPCLPKMYEICSEKLKLNKSLVDIGIPLSTMFMVTQKVCNLVVYTLGMVALYGMEISLSQFIAVLICSYLLVYTVPPVPLGTVAIVSLLLTIPAVPAEAISLVVAIDAVAGFFVAPPIAVATVVALAAINQSVEGQP